MTLHVSLVIKPGDKSIFELLSHLVRIYVEGVVLLLSDCLNGQFYMLLIKSSNFKKNPEKKIRSRIVQKPFSTMFSMKTCASLASIHLFVYSPMINQPALPAVRMTVLKTESHPIQPFSMFTCFWPLGHRGWLLKPIPGVKGRRQRTPWTSC